MTQDKREEILKKLNDEEFKIVDDDNNELFDQILSVLGARKSRQETYPRLISKIELQFQIDEDENELVKGTTIFMPVDLGALGYVGYDGGFLVSPTARNSNGNQIKQKTFPFYAFEEMIEEFFEDSSANHYDTNNLVDLFVFLKLGEKQKDGNEIIFPKLELEFVKQKEFEEPDCVASIIKDGKVVVEKIEFEKLNGSCKRLNKEIFGKQQIKENFEF